MIRALAVALWLAVALAVHVNTFWVDLPRVVAGFPDVLMAGGHWAMRPAVLAHGRCSSAPVIITRQGQRLPAAQYLQHETASARVGEGFLGPC